MNKNTATLVLFTCILLVYSSSLFSSTRLSSFLKRAGSKTAAEKSFQKTLEYQNRLKAQEAIRALQSQDYIVQKLGRSWDISSWHLAQEMEKILGYDAYTRKFDLAKNKSGWSTKDEIAANLNIASENLRKEMEYTNTSYVVAPFKHRVVPSVGPSLLLGVLFPKAAIVTSPLWIPFVWSLGRGWREKERTKFLESYRMLKQAERSIQKEDKKETYEIKKKTKNNAITEKIGPIKVEGDKQNEQFAPNPFSKNRAFDTVD